MVIPNVLSSVHAPFLCLIGPHPNSMYVNDSLFYEIPIGYHNQFRYYRLQYDPHLQVAEEKLVL